MTRAQQTLSIGLLVSALYLACLYGLIPIFPRLVQEEILPVLPFATLVTFGAYLLASLGWSLLTFNDVPAAHKSLMLEIEQAKVELRKMGVEVD